MKSSSATRILIVDDVAANRIRGGLDTLEGQGVIRARATCHVHVEKR